MHTAVAQVGQDAEVVLAIGAAQLQRLLRVVRHGKGLEGKVVPINAVAIAHQMQQLAHARLPQRMVGAVAHVDRHLVFVGNLQAATNVVAMLVRDEDASQGISRQSCRSGEALLKFF